MFPDEFNFTKKEEKIHTKWLKERPQSVRDLFNKYPPRVYGYRVKPGAPYAISIPGTRVHIIAYNEDGTVQIVTPAKHMLPEARANQVMLGIQHGKSQEWIADMLTKDIETTVDPVYLEAQPYQLALDEPEPWILCTHCWKKSFNKNDIEHKYCGHCHKFHDEL